MGVILFGETLSALDRLLLKAVASKFQKLEPEGTSREGSLGKRNTFISGSQRNCHAFLIGEQMGSPSGKQPTYKGTHITLPRLC